jgi:glutamate dehydrogenase
MSTELPRLDDDGSAAALLREAETRLAAADPDTPHEFVGELYGHTVPEDLLRYDPEDVAYLAARAYDFLRQRVPGRADVRCQPVKLSGSYERNAATVLEIVNDDMPFLLDSVLGELAERRIEVLLVAHPVLHVVREDGRLVRLGEGERESFIHLHLDGVKDAAACAEIAKATETVLGEVRLAVTDWRAMRERVGGIVKELKTNPPPLAVEEIAEAVEFLQWLLADNFTFLGVRDYELKEKTLKADFDNALGIMRSRGVKVLRRGKDLLEFTPEIMAFLNEPRPLIVAKANVRSRVHRRAYMDYIGIKHLDAAGHLIGERRIVGLFTSTAYTRPAHTIPYLRRKIAAVSQRAGFDPASHSGKALTNVLEHYPRDELFQIEEDALYHNSIAILQLGERPRVRVLARRDRFDRFVSVLVFVPRDRYGSGVRLRIGAYLASAFIGHVSAFYPYFPDEGSLVRVHFIIGRSSGPTPDVAQVTLEREIAAIVRTWADGLTEALSLSHSSDETHALFARYRRAFSEGYQEAYAPPVAAHDVNVVEALSKERPLAADFHHRLEEEQRAAGLKVWSFGSPLPLSQRVPVLENMGFRVIDERTYQIAPESGPEAWLHDMLLGRSGDGEIDLSERAWLEDAFLQIMRGAAESDGYNALTLAAGLDWRCVALIRTISRFLRQLGVPYSQDYMWATFTKHAPMAGKIVALFEARFDPAENEREKKQAEIIARIDDELEKVESLDEDRILRLFVNAVQSAIRTNFYQRKDAGEPKAQIAIKFASGKLTDVPLPRPLYEIFVYSPRAEGVHLRFG